MHLPKCLAVLALIVVLTACSMKTDKSAQLPELNNAFIHSGSADLQRNWWQSFSDSQLNNLVNQGLENNQTLAATYARLQSSYSQLGVSEAKQYPNLNLTVNTASEFDRFGDLSGSSLGFSSSWEIDLWGKISAQVDKAHWDVFAQQANYKIRANSVAGAVSAAWYGWLAELEKQQLFADQYQRTQTSLTVIKRRFALGKNSVTDVWQQERLLASIEAQQARNAAQLAIYQQRLAQWLGINTEALPKLIAQALPLLPALPKTGLPIERLQYRPDIQQAYARLQAANASLAIAITEKFPRLTIRAGYSTSENSTYDLFENWSGNLAANLAMPLIDMGSREAGVKQKEFLYDAAYADYRQTWLDAIYAVERALISEKQLEQVANNINEQMRLAKKTERLTSLKYLNGKSTYLSLLRAQETILNLERQAVDAQHTLITNRISLYRELSHADFGSTNGGTNDSVNGIDTELNTSDKNDNGLPQLSVIKLTENNNSLPPHLPDLENK